MSQKAEKIKGEDKFGKFTLSLLIDGASCDVCGHSCSVRVGYNFATIRLPDGIKCGDTIVHTPSRMWIGITCGCYAKFHRQVAHIETRMKNNA